MGGQAGVAFATPLVRPGLRRRTASDAYGVGVSQSSARVAGRLAKGTGKEGGKEKRNEGRVAQAGQRGRPGWPTTSGTTSCVARHRVIILPSSSTTHGRRGRGCHGKGYSERWEMKTMLCGAQAMPGRTAGRLGRQTARASRSAPPPQTEPTQKPQRRRDSPPPVPPTRPILRGPPPPPLPPPPLPPPPLPPGRR